MEDGRLKGSGLGPVWEGVEDGLKSQRREKSRHLYVMFFPRPELWESSDKP